MKKCDVPDILAHDGSCNPADLRIRIPDKSTMERQETMVQTTGYQCACEAIERRTPAKTAEMMCAPERDSKPPAPGWSNGGRNPLRTLWDASAPKRNDESNPNSERSGSRYLKMTPSEGNVNGIE
jgi:hypothetical protein